MPKDLRSYLSLLKKTMPRDLIEIDREVDPKFECAGVVMKFEQMRQFPALFFKRVKGSKIPVLSNIHASYRRMALALDTTVEKLDAEYRRREEHPIKCPIVKAGPVRDILLTGKDVDLNILPNTTLHEKDAGPYISAGPMIMRDPELCHRNIGLYRLMIQKPDQMGVQISETAQGHTIYRKYEWMDKPMEVAIAVGHHPAFYIGSVANTSPGIDQLDVTGGIMGEPMELVKCETVDLEVPAHAEIVVEGYIPPKIREPEAPYGEFPGTYGPRRDNPIIKVTAITMRRDAIYQDAFSGHPDNLIMGSFSRLNVVYKFAKHAAPSVQDIHMPLSGRCRFMCFIKMRKVIEGEPKNAMFAAFAADPFLKFVVVVDDDVDTRNDSEVFHAIATRVRGHKDIFIVPYAKGSPLDGTVEGAAMVTKVGIDATRHPGYPLEIKVPGVDKINLRDYISQDVLDAYFKANLVEPLLRLDLNR